jgi:hypothetical protein
MPEPPDQRLINAVRQLVERKRRIAAERRASMLRALVVHMQIERRQMKAALASGAC